MVDGSACQLLERPEASDAGSVAAAQDSQVYATRIKEHANRAANIDIHSGESYRALAEYLNKPFAEPNYAARTEVRTSSAPSPVWVHSIVEESKPNAKIHRALNHCDDFTQDPPSLANNAAHLIWLSGLPAPEWINVIGAQYHIDPEFFRRHLTFLQSKDNQDISAMPSSTERMLTVRLTTICRRSVVLSRPAIEQARSDASESVRRYQQRLRRTGDSIVRKYLIFDNTISTIEQEMAIYVKRSKRHDGWIAIICSDVGRNLTQGPRAPWQSDGPGIFPSCESVVMHVPKLALERPPRPRGPSSARASNAGPMSQNASLLAETFELPSANDALRLDVRDSLHGLFAFASAAEYQFLTMMQGLVDRELHLQSSGKQTEWTLSNLRYFKSALDDHIVNLENMLAFLGRLEVPRWTPTLKEGSPSRSHLQLQSPPRIPSGKSSSRLSSLGDDYAHLLQRANKLSNRCVENTTILMNMAMLEESKKAIAQADGMTRLTLLAFFFLPLSLTTSFFGMNFAEFGTGKMSIWVCFAVAVPFLSFSTVLCFWDSFSARFQRSFKWTKWN